MIYSKASVNKYYDRFKKQSNPDKYLGSVEPKLQDLLKDDVLRTVTNRKKKTDVRKIIGKSGNIVA